MKQLSQHNQASKRTQDDIFKFVESQLRKLNIEIEQNEIEIVLSYFNFDQDKTINSFKSNQAKNILSEWKLAKKKKNVQLHSKTSTPIKTLNDCHSTKINPNIYDLRNTYSNDLNLRENDPNSVTISPKVSTTQVSYVLDEKKSCWIDDDFTKNIKSYEDSIKEYEKKMENCGDSALLKYYIESASDLRKQITLLLNIYQKTINDIKIVEEVTNLSSKVDSLSSNVDSLSLMVHSLSSKVDSLSSKVDTISKQNNHRLKQELDCWESSSSRTKDEQIDFKNSLIIYYNCGDINTKQIKCMVLNKFFDRTLVRAAHIWKAATKGVGLPEFSLKESDLNNERNGLLLHESIEKAFDHKQLCFIYNPFTGYLHVKILCINLKNMFIINDPQMRINLNEIRKFNDIDGNTLMLPKDIYPYRRLLNWHARCAYKTAKLNKWIDDNEQLEDFFYLSELVSLPGDDRDE